MARPSAEVIDSRLQANGETWEILRAETSYVITYDNEPVNIRSLVPGLGGTKLKYKKLSYTNRANAMAQVRRLNRRFDTDRFGCHEVRI
jgi:hypothetical protein